jgi:4-hydroxy-tetrahydrodipicolinate synthase
MKKLYGTGVALVTPFQKNGEIDFDALKKVLDHTAKGVDYYVVMGTTGESATVTTEEKSAILDFVKQNNPKKLPIVYGIGGNNTAEVINQINSTNLKGVSALLSVSPYYNKPSQEGIYQHFTVVAAVCPVPVILYNVPGRTASNLTAETILRLADNPNIIGVKEASGNLEQCMRIARKAPKDFMLISGDDLLTAPMMAIGGVGVISVLANAFPTIFGSMTRAGLKKDYKTASEETFKLLDINGPMYEEGNPAGIKYLMELMKLCKRHTRLPVVPPTEGLEQKIKTAYAAMSKS